MKRILVMGLPGSGKTTLAAAISHRLTAHSKTVEWLNADVIREQFNDWDFSVDGRIRQSIRMRNLADSMKSADYVICDFVAPIKEMRDNFSPDWLIWLDTIDSGRFEDTNRLFTHPETYDFRVTEKNSEKWCSIIVANILDNTPHDRINSTNII